MYRMAWGRVSEPKEGEESIHRTLAALNAGVRQCLHMGRVPGMEFQ